MAVGALVLAGFLGFSGVIGSEFLPHLDEGAIWVRGTLAPSTGPTDERGHHEQGARRSGRLSRGHQTWSARWDGPTTAPTRPASSIPNILSTCYPKRSGGPSFNQNKDELIGAMNRELEKMPGVIWNFSQPISDNVEEAVSGVKGELAVKLYGDDLKFAGGKERPDRIHYE